MPWYLLIPVAQGILGAIGAAGGPGADGTGGLFSAEIQRWLLLAAGLPLTVQVPLAAHVLSQNTKKANVAIQTLASLPLANLHVKADTRSQVYAFAHMPEPEPDEPVAYKPFAPERKRPL